MPTDDVVTIYGLVDPTTDQLRYVGKTKASLHVRLRAHISDAGRDRKNIPRFIWIRRLRKADILPEIVEIETVSKDAWQEAERHWIEVMRWLGCDLLNATAGGDGIAEHKHSDDTKRRQSEAAKRRYAMPGERERTGAAVRKAFENPRTRANLRAAAAKRDHPNPEALIRYNRSERGRAETSARLKGRKFSDETRRKISEAATGRRRSAESIERQRQKMIGGRHSEETKRKMSVIKKGNKNWLGKKHSAESRAKMANSIRIWWEKRRQICTLP